MLADAVLALVALAVGLVVTAAGMPLVLAVCKKWNLYDQPGRRKIHHNAVPRLGGMLFAPAILLAMSLVLWLSGVDALHVHPAVLMLASGMFLIYMVGLVDDIVGVSAKHKFLVQILSGLILPFCHLYINNLYGLAGICELPAWVGYGLTMLVLLLVVNSVNLIDGIDGLASGLGILSLASFAILFYWAGSWIYVWLALALLGALLGFFFYNMWGSVERNTKIFMGDSGSLILGYALAFFAIKYAMSNEQVLADRPAALMAPFTILLIPVFDLVRVAFGRLQRGRSIFYADKTHLHHKLMELMSMHKALLVILGLYVLFCGANAFLLWAQLSSTAVVVIDVLVFAGFIQMINWKIVRKRQKSH